MANDDDSKKGVEMILTNSDEWKKYEDKDPEEQAKIIQHHWALYGDTVVTAINTQRSNKIAQIRAVYIKAWEKGQTPPNSEELLDLVCRRGLKGKQNKTNRQWFAWYMDDLLSKSAGKECWSSEIRCWEGPSTACIPNTNIKFIPSGTEAFVVFAVENAYDRWVFERDLKKKGLKYNKEDPLHVVAYTTKYSDSSAGQSKFGGWSAKGRKRFEKLTDIISKARAKPRGKAAEIQCLETLRIKYKMEEKEGKKKKKKVPAEGTEPYCDGAIAWGEESDAEATVGADSDEEEEQEEQEEQEEEPPVQDEEGQVQDGLDQGEDE
jgi:hypothetical protein